MFAPTFGGLVAYLISLINNTVVPVIFAVTFLAFLYGVLKFFFINVDDSKGRESGKLFIMWGLIGMAVMLSVWGLVRIIVNTFGLQNFFYF
jgi:zinc transporter ZupT